MKHPRVLYAKAVYGKEEIEAVKDVLSKSNTLVAGLETETFEKRVAEIMGVKYGVMVNSGSSANMVALDLLDLPRGAEIITPLLTFSTTVAPMIQRGLIPTFVDVEHQMYTINVNEIEKYITKKTRALFIPLLLGNVPDLVKLRKIANKYKLYLILDSCDTLGAIYKNKPIGKYADIVTTSFYASHIITAGGVGGMVLVNKKRWFHKAKMLRGWGRSSSLFSESEDVKKRFTRQLNGEYYDGKFIFDEIGYNLWPHEMGSAFGNVQLDRFENFFNLRVENFFNLNNFFYDHRDFFLRPKIHANVHNAWLAYPLTIKTRIFSRIELVKYLEKHNIQTRPIFTGNILKQPAFKNIKCKVRGDYPITNNIMKNGLLIGCHQGITKRDLEHIKQTIKSFLEDRLTKPKERFTF